MNSTPFRAIAVGAVVVLAVESVSAYSAVTFDAAVSEAPIVLRAVCNRADQGEVELAVVEVLRGSSPSTVRVGQSQWFFRPLKRNHEYVVLLANDGRPYVGPLLGESADSQVPMYLCGMVNVLEVVNGFLYGEGGFVKKADGKRLSCAELKARLAPVGGRLSNSTLSPSHSRVTPLAEGTQAARRGARGLA